MLSAIALLTASTLTSNAAVVKKDPKDVKIYINPGHGGWNSNCRPMGTVKRGANVTTATTANDTTAFFESNTNLWKCLAMYHKLVDYGVPEYGSNALFDANNYKNQHLVMSRITNGNSTDRGLSTDIAVEVEKYSPDIFISVHSNASPDGTIGSNENYPLVIYRGEDYRSTAFTDTGYGKNWDYAGTGLNGAGSSYEFSKLVYSHLATIKHEPYTTEWKDQYVSDDNYTPLKTEHNVRGDVNLQDYFNFLNNGSFTLNGNRGSGTTNSYSGKTYYGYYGVMKHGAVGCLSEGYMHTYYPSVNRHMNKDVCAIEGISYAHAIADYFGWEKEKTGYIYGIVRDRNQTFTHTYYIPNQSTDDIYKPLNNCTVYLCDKYGNRLYNSEKPETAKYKYVTDDEYNGAFVFYDLEPGDYTLDYECAGYQAASQGLKSTIVTVKANEISYPKAFLNAEGYTMNTNVSFAVNQAKSISGGYNSTTGWGKQMAAANDVCYIIYPRTTAATTNFYYVNMSTATSISNAQGGQNSGAMAGWGIASDDSNNVIMAYGINYVSKITKVRVYKATSFGNAINESSYKEISLSTYTTNLQGGGGTGRTDFWKASGNCYDGEGALWFTDGKTIVKVPIKNGVAQAEVIYTFPDIDADGDGDADNLAGYPTQVTFKPYSNNEFVYSGQVGVYDCKINTDNSISATKVATTWDGTLTGAVHSSDIAYLQGHKLLVRPNTASIDGYIVIEDLTTGTTLTTLNVGKHSLSLSVNAWCELKKIDDLTLGLYVYVPSKSIQKYLIKATVTEGQPDDPVAVTGVVGSTEAEVVANNYEPNITVTWEAPDTWTQQPTNYLVQYRMYCFQDDGTIKYLTNNTSSGSTLYTDAWYTAGFTEDATCKFVHEGVEFLSSSTKKTVSPLYYEYRIIPNFNYYDGEMSEISDSATVEFIGPEPEWSSFTIEPVIEDNELKQYDATAIWYGVDFESNKEFSLQGYKLELFRSDATEKTDSVASFSFKISGLGELTDNVGAVLDDKGNAIENLTYSKAVNPSTGATVNQFRYNAYDLDVLDVNNDGTAEGKEFTAQVTAEFWITDSEFAYGVDDIPVTCKNAYTPVAPSVKQPVVKYYEDLQWGDWDADYYGNPAKGEYDKDDAYWKVYWVNMDITKPNAEVPVSSYTMTLASKGKSDVTEVMLYDPNGSLGLPIITEGYATGYVALPVNVVAETYSARSTVEATSATFTIPGNYDFSQAEEANVPMATFYVKDFTPMGGATNDTDGDNSALNYTYTVAANYASGNTAISSTATGGATPIDGGITTAVEDIAIAGAVSNVMVYPVPATVSVTIKASEAIEQVAIYSAAGAIVKSLQGDGECVMTIAVDDLEVGTYFVRVNNLAPVKIAKN